MQSEQHGPLTDLLLELGHLFLQHCLCIPQILLQPLHPLLCHPEHLLMFLLGHAVTKADLNSVTLSPPRPCLRNCCPSPAPREYFPMPPRSDLCDCRWRCPHLWCSLTLSALVSRTDQCISPLWGSQAEALPLHTLYIYSALRKWALMEGPSALQQK